jgi:hypothetical protein
MTSGTYDAENLKWQEKARNVAEKVVRPLARKYDELQQYPWKSRKPSRPKVSSRCGSRRNTAVRAAASPTSASWSKSFPAPAPASASCSP